MKVTRSACFLVIVVSALCVVATYAEDDHDSESRQRVKRVFHNFTISPNTTLVKPDFVDLQIFDGLTDDQIRTLQSIRQIEGTTTYFMTYYGSYGTVNDLFDELDDFPSEQDQRISCSTFSASTPAGEPIFAYNNDNADADWMLVILADPPDAYATMCITSTRFCRIRQYAQRVQDTQVRDFILLAPFLSFDGINEYGVTMSPMSNDDGERVYDPNKRSLHGLTTIRLVLDSARNVQEALVLLNRYNNTFSNQIHYLLSDAYGNSVVIEYYDGRVVPTWKSGPFQICTNSRVNGYQNDASHWRVTCWRYWNLLSWLGACSGVVTEERAFAFLAGVAVQPTNDNPGRTVWSSVYNNITGTWELVLDRAYDDAYSFSMPMITDLAVGSVKLLTKSQPARIGGKVRLYARIRNAGIRPSPATKVAFYLSSAKKIGSKSILLKNYSLKELAAGEKTIIKTSASLPTEIKPGRYYLIVFVDPDGGNREEEIENNRRASNSKYRIQ